MITSVTGVTRSGGTDLPTPAVRTATASREPSSGGRAPASASGPAGPTDVAGAPAASGTAKPAATEKRESESQRDADGGMAAAATSRYLAELLTARVIGGATPTGRPSQITPERLSSLISYLETDLAPVGTSTASGNSGGTTAKPASGSVDVTS